MAQSCRQLSDCPSNFHETECEDKHICGKVYVIQMDEDTKAAVIAATRAKVSQWTGVAENDLELTSFHPIRVYYDGATLITHVDRYVDSG